MRLIRASGETITPSDDAKLFEQILDDGLFGEVAFTVTGGQISLPAFKGVMCGRDFSTDAMLLSPALPVGSTANGYVIAQIDLTQPAGNQFSIIGVLQPYTLTKDNINDAGGTMYEMILATYTATSSGVTAVTMAYDKACPILSKDAHIKHFGGDQYGLGLLLEAGGTTIISGGEAGTALVANNINGAAAGTSENVHIAADNTLFFYSNCQTIANCKQMTFSTGGNLAVPGTVSTGGKELYPITYAPATFDLHKATWKKATGLYYAEFPVTGWKWIFGLTITNWGGLNALVVPYIVSTNKIGFMTTASSFPSSSASVALRIEGVLS